MEALLAFLFVVFLTSMRGSRREVRPRQSGAIFVMSVAVALALLSHRVA